MVRNRKGSRKRPPFGAFCLARAKRYFANAATPVVMSTSTVLVGDFDLDEGSKDMPQVMGFAVVPFAAFGM